MTPFGERIRAMRAERGISQGEMARALGVSAAYLSALERGRRGAPSWPMVQKVIGFFNVIWDEAEALEELAKRSHPRVVVDTTGLSSEATVFANLVAQAIGDLAPDDLRRLSHEIERLVRTGDQNSASRSSSRSLTSQP